MWIRACIVLHTLIGEIERGKENDEFVEALIHEGQEDFSLQEDLLEPDELDDTRRETPGWKFRRRLRDKAVTQGLFRA